jgi:hypothetical protein
MESNQKSFCSWCFKGGRDCNHRLKDSFGNITCPDLLSKRCTHCQCYGHFSSHCKKRPAETKLCNFCGLIGHLVSECSLKSNKYCVSCKTNNHNTNECTKLLIYGVRVSDLSGLFGENCYSINC